MKKVKKLVTMPASLRFTSICMYNIREHRSDKNVAGTRNTSEAKVNMETFVYKNEKVLHVVVIEIFSMRAMQCKAMQNNKKCTKLTS